MKTLSDIFQPIVNNYIQEPSNRGLLITEAKADLKQLMLDLVEQCDPASKVRDPKTAYWGNVLREKINEL